MKVRYIAHLDDIDLTEGAVYKVLSVEKNWYRIVDDSDDDYYTRLTYLNHRRVIMLVNI